MLRNAETLRLCPIKLPRGKKNVSRSTKPDATYEEIKIAIGVAEAKLSSGNGKTRALLRKTQIAGHGKRKTAAKFALHPDIASRPDFLQALARVRNLEEFDDLYTAPVHGFANAQDYWTRASAKPWLKHITVPTLVLNARNDPFQPAAVLPQAHEVSAAVRLEQPEDGGHVGFAVGRFPGRLHWLSLRILRWIDGH